MDNSQSLNELPVELLLHEIFPSVSVSDIVSLAQVNRRFHTIAQDNHLWKTLLEKDFLQRVGIKLEEAYDSRIDYKAEYQAMKRDADAHNKYIGDSLDSFLVKSGCLSTLPMRWRAWSPFELLAKGFIELAVQYQQQVVLDYFYNNNIKRWYATETVDYDRNTLIHWAAMLNQKDALELLLSQEKGDLNPKNTYYITPWVFAHMYGHTACQECLEAHQVTPASQGDFETALRKAAQVGQQQYVALLLALPGIDPNSASAADGKTALHNTASLNYIDSSCHKGVLACVDLLLADPRIEPNQRDGAGKTAWDHAIAKGYFDHVLRLSMCPKVKPSNVSLEISNSSQIMLQQLVWIASVICDLQLFQSQGFLPIQLGFFPNPPEPAALAQRLKQAKALDPNFFEQYIKDILTNPLMLPQMTDLQRELLSCDETVRTIPGVASLEQGSATEGRDAIIDKYNEQNSWFSRQPTSSFARLNV